jgi:signal transduction histidine kinase
MQSWNRGLGIGGAVVSGDLVGRVGPKEWLADDSRVRYVAGVALLTALYYAATRVSSDLNFAGATSSIVWLPVGVGIAFLYLAGIRYWPGVLVGDLVIEFFVENDPAGQALGITLGNTLQVVVATLLLRNFDRRGRPLATVEGVVGMVIAIAGGMAVGATLSSLTLRLSHAVTAGMLSAQWRGWWLSGFCGAALVVPLAFAWYPWPRIDLRRRPSWDAILPLAAVVGTSALVFQSSRPWSYLVFPALMWTAWRLGPRGATVAVAIAAGFAVWATTHLVGPFHSFSANRSVLDTQLFIVVAALSTVCFAALAADRERLAGALRASLARVVETSERERQRLERDIHDGAQALLVAVQIRLGLVRELTDPAQIAEQIDQTQQDLETAMEELRTLARGIYPRALHDLGPAGALQSLALSSPVPVTVIDDGIGRSSDATEAAIYFCASEAIQNAAKHAGPGAKATVTLTRGGNEVTLTVSDDGVGMPADRDPEAIGLTSMRDRVEAVGGRFEIVSAPGEGTSILAAIPEGPRAYRLPNRERAA